jgi:hypothetical protein
MVAAATRLTAAFAHLPTFSRSTSVPFFHKYRSENDVQAVNLAASRAARRWSARYLIPVMLCPPQMPIRAACETN